jgi:phosphoribosylformylglycinamidine synthase
VSIPPSLLITALGQIRDVSHAVTMDAKEAGNLIYLVGSTKAELGGSHFALVNNLEGGDGPQVDLAAAPKIFQAVHAAITRRLVRSCHDLSEGGLAVAAAEMAFAGDLGLELNLAPLRRATGIDDPVALLFSESNTRFLIEVIPQRRGEFEGVFQGLPSVLLGRVSGDPRFRVSLDGHAPIIDSSLVDLKKAWKSPLAWD